MRMLCTGEYENTSDCMNLFNYVLRFEKSSAREVHKPAVSWPPIKAAARLPESSPPPLGHVLLDQISGTSPGAAWPVGRWAAQSGLCIAFQASFRASWPPMMACLRHRLQGMQSIICCPEPLLFALGWFHSCGLLLLLARYYSPLFHASKPPAYYHTAPET
jgi:hypothetical protein